jgi:hypothetical protein
MCRHRRVACDGEIARAIRSRHERHSPTAMLCRRVVEEQPPLQGRNWMELSMMVKGITANSITNQPGVSNDDFFQLNLDGQQITQKLAGSGFGQPAFSRDAIAEFQIVTSQFDITQGRSAGIQVQAISKSGTNLNAGSFYGFFRSDAFKRARQSSEDGSAVFRSANRRNVGRSDREGQVALLCLVRVRAPAWNDFLVAIRPRRPDVHVPDEDHPAKPAGASGRGALGQGSAVGARLALGLEQSVQSKRRQLSLNRQRARSTRATVAATRHSCRPA